MGKKSKKKKERKSLKVKSDTFADMEKKFRELERRLEDVFSDNWGMPSKWEFPEWNKLRKIKLTTPRVDIVDRDDDILVRADVPGVDRENLDVSFTDHTITIRCSTSESKKEEKGDYYRNETMKGSFTRTMYLPSDIVGSKASSTFKDGVLEVVVPKLEKARRIRVDIP